MSAVPLARVMDAILSGLDDSVCAQHSLLWTLTSTALQRLRVHTRHLPAPQQLLLNSHSCVFRPLYQVGCAFCKGTFACMGRSKMPANAELLKQNVPNPLCLLGLFILNNLKYTALDVPGMYIHQFFFKSYPFSLGSCPGKSV